MNLLRRFALLNIVGLSMVGAGAQSAPEYFVQGNTLRHSKRGGYQIEVAWDLKYVGGTRFHIRDAADAEQHLFVKANPHGEVEKLVWIQFESQLPGQKWQYDYPSPDRLKLGELIFIADSRAFNAYRAGDPNSDHGHADQLLNKNGLKLDGPTVRLRMIHLPDAKRRRELMIIYAVPLQTKRAIPEDGEDAGKWPAELVAIKQQARQDVRAKMLP